MLRVLEPPTPGGEAALRAFTLRHTVSVWLQPNVDFGFDLQSIGYIVPGLIANEMAHQNVLKTTAGLGTVTIIVYLLLLLIR